MLTVEVGVELGRSGLLYVEVGVVL